MKIIYAISFLGVVGFGIFYFGFSSTLPTEAEFNYLDQNYKSHQNETIAALERNYKSCFPSAFAPENVNFAVKYFVRGFGHGVEFRSQPNLPAIGTNERDMLQANDEMNFAKTISADMLQEFSQMPKARQDEVAKMSDQIGSQKDYYLKCAEKGAIQDLSKAGF